MATSAKVHPKNSSGVENNNSYDTPSAERSVAFRGDEEIEEDMENVSTSTPPHEAKIKSIVPASREVLDNWFMLAFMIVVLLVSITAIVLSVLVTLKINNSDETESENSPGTSRMVMIHCIS